MDSQFILKLVLSFLVGSIWITTGTVIAERYGSRVGGLVAGLPATILVSLFFIAWTQSTTVAAEATTVIPVVMGINSFFAVVYIVLVRFNFWLALAGALTLWGFCAYLLVLARFDSFGLSLGLYLFLLLAAHIIVEKWLAVVSEPGKKMKYAFPVILFRALFSGSVIAVAVIMAKVGGPLLGGMFSVFPAMFIGTLVITYYTHGPAFSAAVMKASVLGAVSVVVYGAAVRYTYIPLGIWLGTLLSLAMSFLCSFVVHLVMNDRTR